MFTLSSSNQEGYCLYARSVVLTMPRSKLEVLRKPLRTNVDIEAHAICVETTMQILVRNCEISQVSNLQDKHNASYFYYVLHLRYALSIS